MQVTINRILDWNMLLKIFIYKIILFNAFSLFSFNNEIIFQLIYRLLNEKREAFDAIELLKLISKHNILLKQYSGDKQRFSPTSSDIESMNRHLFKVTLTILNCELTAHCA